jgi:hypothetical protein
MEAGTRNVFSRSRISESPLLGRSLAWQAFLAIGALLIAAFAVPPIAEAAVPSSDWTVALPRASQVFTNPSGGVLAIIRAADEPDSQSRVQQVTASGDLDWKTDIAAGLTVTPDAVFDGPGNVYWGEEGIDGSWVTARSATGASLWRVAMPQGWTNYRLTVGLNGDLYALGATSDGQESLLRIAHETGALSTPVLVPGTITGCCTDLYAYKGGLVAAGSEVVYLDYSGQITHHYALPAGNIFKVFAANADGEVFAGVEPDGPGGSCNYGEGQISISKYSPTGGRLWSYLAPSTGHCNIGFLRLAALPSGGVVATVGSDGTDGSGLTTLSPDGAVLWSKTPQPAESGTTVGDIFQMRADTAGHIIVLESVRLLCRSGAEVCDGTQLDFYSEGDGSKAESSDVFQEPDPTPGMYDPAAQPISFAIDTGRVYLALQHSNGTPLTTTAVDYPLFAVNVASLTKQYPSAFLIEPPTPTPTPTPTPKGISASAILSDPLPTDKLLRRGLAISASPATSGPAIAYFRYGWSPASSAATKPTVGLQKCTVLSGKCTVTFAATGPNQPWKLWVRAVDQSGGYSPWTLASTVSGSTTIDTPSTPILVVIGDSISSGHHRDGQVAPTICNDPDYGYPIYVWKRMRASLPEAWRGSGYYNFARSGFGTDKVLAGGSDACGAVYKNPGPIADAKAIVRSHRGSWTRVVATAGIDDTNWVGRLGVVGQNGGLGVNPQYSAGNCSRDLAAWNGFDSDVQRKISGNIADIVNGLQATDPSVFITWRGYYNISGTGLVIGLPSGVPVPPVCSKPVQKAVNTINSTIASALTPFGGSVRYVNSDKVMHEASELVQPFFIADALSRCKLDRPEIYKCGWPHPNRSGAAAMANQVTP